MDMNAKPKKKESVIVEHLDEEFMLYDMASSDMFTINKTGMLVWQVCTGLNPASKIVEAMVAMHPDEADKVSQDVTQTLQAFQDHQLITLV